jgi:hypothetical protein
MPDGDRFERKLRGKGWRSVYRLGCSDAPINAVADRVMGAAAAVFRVGPVEGVRKIFTALLESLDPLRDPLFRESLSKHEFYQLTSEVQVILTDEVFSELSRLSESAAFQTFNEIELLGEIPSRDVIAQQFTKELVCRLAERHCLSAVREGIMENSGRSQLEQLKWEGEVKTAISKPCASLSKSFLIEDSDRAIRAPRRQFKPAAMTLEALNQSLQVRGDSR